MAIILGITHGKQADVDVMFETVRHRGDAHFETKNLDTHFFATARNKRDLTLQTSSGLYSAEDNMVAIAGAITDENYQGFSPEDISHLFQKKGIDIIKHIQGAYVLAIQTKTHLYLVRDATGQRTIYYNHQQNRLAFCIEPKGIHALPYYSPALNISSVFQYFTFSFVPLHNTMLEGIHELPAGYLMTFDLEKNTIDLDRYFKLEDLQKHHQGDLDYWKNRIRHEIQREIDDKLTAQDDVGVFLSGGLDSSIIASQVAARHLKKVHTFSIHFGKQYLNELDFAQKVADRYQTQHHELEIRPQNFLPKLWKIIWLLDDPIGDPITVPNFELAKYAADFVPIIFNGEGGDPCFGGPKNIPMLLSHWYGGVDREQNFREKAYLASYRRGYKYLQQLLSPQLLQQFNEEQQLENILQPFFSAPKFNFLDKLMSINIRLKGAHLILPKVERMLGASGLPAIAPLFTKAITCSSMEMPAEFKLNKGVEKYILKQAFAQDLPAQIIARSKSGMRVPVRYWFQGEMKKYARKILTPKAIKRAGIFNADTVKQLLAYDSTSGLSRHGLLLWMIITFEIWRQIFIENQEI